MKYRKKPVVVEAIQWNGNNLKEVMEFMDSEFSYDENTDYVTNKFSYYKPTNVFQTHKLNNAYDVDDKTDVELQYLVRREIDEVDIIQTDATPGRNDYMVEQEAYDVDQSRINQQGTKVLDLNTVRLFQAHNTDPYRLALDYWLYMVSKDKFTYTIN